MHFIIRLFPEIIIKSTPVRQKLIRQLQQNLERLFKSQRMAVKLQRDWEKIQLWLPTEDQASRSQVVDLLSRVPGVDQILEVGSFTFERFAELPTKVHNLVQESLDGKTFCVRAKRHGEHDFNSRDVEIEVGGFLLHNTQASRVQLVNPDVTVQLDIKHNQVFVIKARWLGLGGYPLGTQNAALSLISGGFDSSVSSYMTMRRGILTHFLFFNLGGRSHEIAVREMAYHLWDRFGRSHTVQFISVPFEPIVAQIVETVPSHYAGVILKRMMLRVAGHIAERKKFDALVTGESIGQVSSQTLKNLTHLDAVIPQLILRPLIVTDKEEIVRTARRIGTSKAAEAMPEYCGAVSNHPTTSAKLELIEKAEARFDFDLLHQVIAQTTFQPIEEVMHTAEALPVDILHEPRVGSVVIDVRHPDESTYSPLTLDAPVQSIPYFRLQEAFPKLSSKTTYLLYCTHGVMSQLHAEMLIEAGHRNVGVFRPK